MLLDLFSLDGKGSRLKEVFCFIPFEIFLVVFFSPPSLNYLIFLYMLRKQRFYPEVA